ncbi:MAG: MarR family transcriptional regulator [Clostridia bacterium]|nr:MarR family transcriptional regulator [Clostridia bacterium]
MEQKVEKLDTAFKRFHGLRREIIDAKFREYGLGFGQPPILKYLSDHENVTQKEIADCLHVSQPAIAKSLKKMEEAGFIVRLENKKDTRCHKLKLTKKGKEIVSFADDYFLNIDNITYTGFTEDEIELLSSFVERMNKNLMSFSKKEDTNV